MARGKVLVVDDEPGIVAIVQANLESEGYTVISAADGEEALRRVQGEHPDLVILDVMMPVMDGWQVLERLERDNATAGLPIIMLTAKVEDEDILLGLEQGAVEYITKPFYPEDLTASVTLLLSVFDRGLREKRRQELIARRKRLMSPR